MPGATLRPGRTRVVTFNANGIRAAARKGFFQWLEREEPDIVCVQETRAQAHQLEDAVFRPDGYHVVYNDAVRKGYSGTAIFSRVPPRRIVTDPGWPVAAEEGRYLEFEYAGLSVISLYVPSGSSSDEAQARKYRFMEPLFEHLAALRRRRRQSVVCADWNICHREIDLRNWRANRGNSGFLPEERAWLDRVFDELGFLDSFRLVEPGPDHYTWWSNRGQAWSRNVGWRLDYQLISPGLEHRVRRASIYRDERFSDHAPHTMEYDFALAR